jgi:hypothetical protein
MNEHLLNNNPYCDLANMDNQPSHRILLKEGNEEEEIEAEYEEYWQASKNFLKVDPKITDKRNFQYAPEHNVYLLLRNKYTGEWEFPT